MRKISKTGLAAIVCIMLMAFTSIGVTVAYFSDHTEAEGEAVVNLTARVEIPETVDEYGIKHIRVRNTGKTDVVVRVAIYGPWLTEDAQKEDIKAPAEDWEYIGGYYYYKHILPAGTEENPSLTSEITVEPPEIPKDSDVQNFDITAMFESAIVTYDENGAIVKPDKWENFPNITE